MERRVSICAGNPGERGEDDDISRMIERGRAMTKRRRSAFRGVICVEDRHGRLRHRLRRRIDGRNIDCYLPGVYGSAEFVAAYQAAIEGARAPSCRRAKVGTIDQLKAAYLASTAYASLSDRTKREKAARLDWIGGVIGTAPYADVRPHHVEALMAKRGTPTAGNRIRMDMVQLFAVAAKNYAFAGANPAKLADAYAVRSEGHHTWTDAELDMFRQHHASGTTARLAFELMLGTGAARSDAAAMTRASIKGGMVHYRRAKTGEAVAVPVAAELAAELAEMPADRLVLFVDEAGRPMGPRGLGDRFARWVGQAGLPDRCRAHGLRKAAARRLAEAGATEHELMATLGHATPAMAARYARAANRGRMAASGAAKLSNLPDRLDKRGS